MANAAAFRDAARGIDGLKRDLAASVEGRDAPFGGEKLASHSVSATYVPANHPYRQSGWRVIARTLRFL